MRRFVECWLGLFLMGTAWAAPRYHTEAELMLSSAVARPGESITAGVRLRMAPGWHTYWLNPGEAGAPTRVDWELPPGVAAGPIQWPVPERYEVSGITTFVYHDEVMLVVPLALSKDLPHGLIPIGAKVSWFECADVCVPGEARVSAKLSIGEESRPSATTDVIRRWQERIVSAAPKSVPAKWQPAQEKERKLAFELDEDSPGADFLPYPGEGYEVVGRPSRVGAESGKTRFEITVSRTGDTWPSVVQGLWVARAGGQSQGTPIELRPVPETREAGGGGVPPPAGTRSLWLLLVFAFLGGLILNFMPCVLPVIALKVLSFVQQSREEPRRIRWLGATYGFGVVVSFIALAVLAIVAREAGGLPSWGMLLQNQVVRVVLTVVVTLVALNLFGLFEVTISSRVLGTAGALAGREGPAGAFFNGVLATVLATPCTAPFLGVALAFAFVQPPLVIILFFVAAGLGLAAPFVLLCWRPGWMKWMPKPGGWMKRFKTAMGFPMLATAIWLFWFTAPRYGKSGVLWLGLFLVAVAAAVWIWGEFVQRGLRGRGIAATVAVLLLSFGYGYFLETQLDWRGKTSGGSEPMVSRGGIEWRSWSPEAVRRARSEGHPVLVDFTADNCLNCQVNKATSLEIPSTAAKLKEIDAVAFLADFTDQDPRIAEELRRHQRSGVPLVLVYPADLSAEPVVLPPLLTPGLVHGALEKAGGRREVRS